jgi:cytochrome bd ubiquinol oxidase subunit I
MISDAVVDLSRIQFAFTALFHFLFVPLTLGITWLLVIMEAAYLKTGKLIYKDMTKFWGKLFAINFALGVVTGVTMEYEFGTNWAFFSRYVGGDFGPILAVEGITAFMLEATMIGLFFFSWNKLSKGMHFFVTCLMAFGASLSIVNILAANSYMQRPIDSYLNFYSMKLHLTSLYSLYFSENAQISIGHVFYAGMIVGATFVTGVSAFYLIRNTDSVLARRSIYISIGFGFVCCIMALFFGDQNGLMISKYQPAKMAATEGQWETQKAPASWYLFAWPDQKHEKNYLEVKIPYALSLIADHNLTGTVEGEKPIMKKNLEKIRQSKFAYASLLNIRKTINAGEKIKTPDLVEYNKYKEYLGYAFLLKRYAPNVLDATEEQMLKATKHSIPDVFISFFSFRIMLACWGLTFLMFIFGLYYCYRGTIHKKKWILWYALLCIPLPYIAAEFGWILRESGRQPWVVYHVMPTAMGVSSISLGDIITSLSGFVIFYGILFLLEVFLMLKYANLGPSCLGTGRYFFEKTKKLEIKKINKKKK